MSELSVGDLPTTSAPFRIGLTLSKTFGLFSRHFGKFLVLSLVPMIPLLLLIGGGQLLTPMTFRVLAVIALPLTILVGAVTHATALYGAFQVMRGHSFTIGQSLQAGLGRALPVIGVALLVALAAMAGLFLLVPGLMIYCAFYVAVPACVIGRSGVIASMSHSATLTKGYRWPIFGLFLLVIIIYIAVSIALDLPMLSQDGPIVPSISNTLLQFAWLIVATAFYSVLVTVVYHDLRVAKGIDTGSLANVFD